MGFSRKEHWSGWPCPPPGDLPHLGIEPVSLVSAGGFFITSATWWVFPVKLNFSKIDDILMATLLLLPRNTQGPEEKDCPVR